MFFLLNKIVTFKVLGKRKIFQLNTRKSFKFGFFENMEE